MKTGIIVLIGIIFIVYLTPIIIHLIIEHGYKKLTIADCIVIFLWPVIVSLILIFGLFLIIYEILFDN